VIRGSDLHGIISVPMGAPQGDEVT
jgi:hypothetical protein